jgi:hypothetical protein
MVGCLKSFLDALADAVPEVSDAFGRISRNRTELLDAALVDGLYQDLQSEDFSRRVLSKCAYRLTVLPLGDAGWSDLGTPKRILSALARTGVLPAWYTNPAFREGLV